MTESNVENEHGEEGQVFSSNPASPVDAVLGRPPVQTSIQELPFNELTWENFERLCHRLAGLSDRVEDYRRFGRRGQAQQGIDIFVRLSSGKYEVWQTKRYQEFTAADFTKATSAFRSGDWFSKTVHFVIAVASSLADVNLQEKIEAEVLAFRNQGILLTVNGAEELSMILKNEPTIVDDFFGRPWAMAFNGLSAGKLATRLDGGEFARVRTQLLSAYEALFRTLDRGLAVSADGIDQVRAPELLERLVDPEIILREQRVFTEEHSNNSSSTNSDAEAAASSKANRRRPPGSSIKVTRKVSLDTWLSTGEQFAITADSGMGKSLLLRCVALDMLGDQTRFRLTGARWGYRLPIYLSFSRWAKAAARAEGPVGLKEIVAANLQDLLTVDLMGLLDRAIDENRVLLLIDGLDEWADEQAARTVLARLLTLVTAHPISIIVAGRPRGLQKIGSIPATWQHGNISGLNDEQRQTMTRKWFDFFSKRDFTVGNDYAAARQATLDTERFLSNLNRDPPLLALAGVPLLLLGLLSISMRGAVLPRSRVEALRQLTHLLLEIHPERRATAAGEVRPRFKFAKDYEMRRVLLGRLAFYIHDNGFDAGLAQLDAKSQLQSFLTNPEGPYALASNRADEIIDELISVNAETVGLLVENSHREIGFAHACFKEFLAASYIQEWPLSKISALASEKAGEPRWRPILSTLAALSARSEEVEGIIAAIEAAVLDKIGNLNRHLLLSEICFSPSKLSVRSTNRLFEMAIGIIERREWPEISSAIMEMALSATGDVVLSPMLEMRFQKWAPRISEYNSTIYEALSNWGQSPDLLEALLGGMRDENDSNRRSAALSLAKVYNSDKDVYARLCEELTNTVNIEYAASLLDCLAVGWKNDPFVQNCLEEGLGSPDVATRVISIRGRISTSTGDDRDKAILLNLAEKHSALGFGDSWWAGWGLATGWPDDDDLIRRAIASFGEHSDQRMDWENDAALEYLTSCSSSNKLIIGWLINVFRSFGPGRSHPFPLHFKWARIVSFAQADAELHRLLVDYITKRIDEFPSYELHDLIVLLRDDEICNCLVAALRKEREDGHWQTFWLLSPLVRGWGRADSRVANLLDEVAQWPLKSLTAVTSLLPEIFQDTKTCRAKLLEIANSKPVHRTGLIGAFVAIGVSTNDNEVVQTLLSGVGDEDLIWDEGDALIANFGAHPDVRTYALARATRRLPPIASYINAYEHDIELRSYVLRCLTTLPASLRSPLAEADTESSPRLRSLQAEFDQEGHGSIKVTLSRQYHRGLSMTDLPKDGVIGDLTKLLFAVGADLDERRAAAFVGFLELGLTSKIVKLKEGDKLVRLSTGSSLQDLPALYGALIDHWADMQSAFGPELYDRLGHFPTTASAIWELLSPYIRTRGAARESFLEHCADVKEPIGLRTLQTLARELPGSHLLHQHCWRCLERTDGRGMPLYDEMAGMEAAYILGEQFPIDDGASERLVRLVEWGARQAPIVAYCTLDPRGAESRELRQRPLDYGLKFGAWTGSLHIAAIRETPAEFVSILSHAVNRTAHSPWDFQTYSNRAVQKRLQSDNAAAHELKSRLIASETPTEIASYSRLLASSGRADADLIEHCRRELSRPYRSRVVPAAYDAVSDAIRSLPHSLYDVVSSASFE